MPIYGAVYLFRDYILYGTLKERVHALLYYQNKWLYSAND